MSSSSLWRGALITGLAFSAMLTACGDADGEPERSAALQTRTLAQPLEAYCTINVVGYGPVDAETDYLPRVIRCENGAAPLEALKAQAVAARGYAYYRMAGTGDINPDTSDQKYDCAGDPSPIHYQAVQETAGQYVEYNNKIVAPFYVAGAIPGDRNSCVAVPGDNDYSNTERHVTYNEGRHWGSPCDQSVPASFTCDDPIPSGCDPPPACQTGLGFKSRRNEPNRGCKSQNGATCLAEKGWGYEQILRFYYGVDIGLPVATGACIQPQVCEISIADDGETIIDQSDTPCFRGGCTQGSSWITTAGGHGGDHIYTYAWDQGVDCSGRWNLDFVAAGTYDVEIFIETSAPLTESALYTVRHAAGTESSFALDQNANKQGQWSSLGRFDFAGGGDQWIELTDNTGEPYTGTDGKRVAFDAVKLIAVSETQPDATPTDTNLGGEDTNGGSTDTTAPTDTALQPGEDTSTLPDATPQEDAGFGEDTQTSGSADNAGPLTARNTGCACALLGSKRASIQSHTTSTLVVLGAFGLMVWRRKRRC